MLSSTIQTILFQSTILARANLKSRYRNSFAGYIWVLLSPLALYSAQAYVFKTIFKIQIENYLVFLLFGLMPWIFFSQTLEMVTTTFHYNGRLLKSLTVHPLSLIFSQVLDNLVNNISTVIIVLIALQINGLVGSNLIYMFPIAYLPLTIAACALGFLLASIHVFFFDLKFLLSFVLNVLFYLSPVIYPEHFVPQEFKFILDFNPFNHLLRPFRSLLESESHTLFFHYLLYSVSLAATFIVLSILYWQRKKNEIYLRL